MKYECFKNLLEYTNKRVPAEYFAPSLVHSVACMRSTRLVN